MKTVTKKSWAEMVLIVVLGLTCCCVVSCGGRTGEEDTTPPVISNVKVFDVTDTSAQISFETDEPAKGEVIWGTTGTAKDTAFVISEEFTTTHNLKISDLLPSTLYYYRLASGDAKNNWKLSEPSTFTTLAKQTQ